MRLRQLAHGQSVVFLAPPFVDKSIRDFCNLKATEEIDSRHVILWSIEQSCLFIEAHRSLWDAQRRSHLQRKARTEAVLAATSENKTEAAELLTEIERRTLSELYGPDEVESEPGIELDAIMITEGREQSRQSLSRACAEEEQERQVDREVQEEQQKQNPTREGPHQHILHPHVRDFMLQGTLERDSPAYQSTFKDMARTDALISHLVPNLPDLERSSKILVTADFHRTLKLRPKSGSDHALRPVRFVAWNRNQPDVAMIISPFEVQHLLATVKQSKNAHILIYEPPRTRSMVKDFGALNFFGIPKLPGKDEISNLIKLELLLYSGALYFPYTKGEEIRGYMRGLNKILDQDDVRRSSSDIGTRIAEVWRKWLGLRMHGTEGPISPAASLIGDKALNPSDHIFRE